MDDDWNDDCTTQDVVDYGTGYGRGRGIISNDDFGSSPGYKSYGRNGNDDNGFGDSSNNNAHGSSSFGGRSSRGNRERGRGGSYRGGRDRTEESGFQDGQENGFGDGDGGFRGGRGGRGGRGRGGGRGGRGGGGGGDDSFKPAGGSDGEEEQKPKENYIPPEPSNDENEMFGSGISSGINFSKYDNIKIKVSGENPPRPIENFDESGLRPILISNVKKCNYRKPTPVQKNAIPIVMAGRDLMACAQTGSGKTAAFLLPIIDNILNNPVSEEAADTEGGYGRSVKPLAVIVSPTRELAIQIFTEARKFSHQSIIRSVVVYGGTSTSHQSSQVQKGCHILVATPGRLLDMVGRGKISFSAIRFVVLDEADRMLDMGFKPAIEQMMSDASMVPTGERQTLMFSATFPEDIQKMAGQFLNNYLFLAVGVVGGACSDVEQQFYKVTKFDKRKKLVEILRQTPELEKTLVFVEQKRMADFIAAFLSEQNFPTTSIHGDRLQSQREGALADFKNGHMPVLVATAVAARGLDIKNVAHVVNFDLPKSIDEYVHRIGRTGRVGNRGKATSFFDPDMDGAIAKDLMKILQQANQEVPNWLEECASECGGSSNYSHGGRFGGRDFRNFEQAEPAYSTEPVQQEEEEVW